MGGARIHRRHGRAAAAARAAADAAVLAAARERPIRSSSAALAPAGVNSGGPPSFRGSIVMVDGVLYPTSPDNVWAVDARDGSILWQYYWKTRGGTHTGHRGVGMWRNFIFTEFHDNYLVKLDAHWTGTMEGRDLGLRSAFRRWRRSSSTTT